MTETYRDAEKPAEAYVEWLKEIESDPDVDNEVVSIARAFCEHAYQHTEEIESGDFDLGTEPVEIVFPFPYLSRLPVIGKVFTAKADLTPLLVLCIQFGEVWEQEHPYNRGALDAAVRLLERTADKKGVNPEETEEMRRIAKMLANNQ